MLPVENYSVQQQNEATDTLQDTCRQQIKLEVCSKPEQVDLPVEAPSTNAEEMMVKPICKRNCIDTEHIITGEKLTDKEINRAQNLLKSQFPKLNGLKLTLHQEKVSVQATTNWLQIIHCRQRDHWILATTIGCDETMVLLYDSVYRNADEPTKVILFKVFPNDIKIKVIGTTQKQLGGKDCGIFAIAFATTLALGGDPGS